MELNEMYEGFEGIVKLTYDEIQKQIDKLQPVVARVNMAELPFLLYVMKKTVEGLEKEHPEAVPVVESLDKLIGDLVELKKEAKIRVRMKKRGNT